VIFLAMVLVFKSVLACHFESSSESTEFAQGEGEKSLRISPQENINNIK